VAGRVDIVFAGVDAGIGRLFADSYGCRLAAKINPRHRLDVERVRRVDENNRIARAVGECQCSAILRGIDDFSNRFGRLVRTFGQGLVDRIGVDAFEIVRLCR